MRYPDGTLIGDLNDNFSAKTSQSLSFIDSSTIDENLTVYDLLPVIISKPPEIVRSITEASQPPIQLYEEVDGTGNSMHLFPDGNVKVNSGASFILTIDAQQPSVFNIENGVPKILPSKIALDYVWIKDGEQMVNEGVGIMNSSVTTNESSLLFENIQPIHAGIYTCEITNDIGTTTSEPITIEVLDLDNDSLIYRNLIKNPYGLNGTADWETSNDELTVKTFSKDPSESFIHPYRVDKFGYTIDMLHPRPYQIDTNAIKYFKMAEDLYENNASYFTRKKYKYESKGGSHVVKAYQDIDLTDAEGLIKGGVFGIEGLRAVFSCYIGNGITGYVPVQELVDPGDRVEPKNYVQNKPRLSVENFLNSGPAFGVSEVAYVTVEEYNNETRLSSRLLQSDGSVVDYLDRIVLTDPWNKRMQKYYGQKYYTNDKYKLGELSQGDSRDQILFTADELYPDLSRRYVYGQYGEFNKIILDKLNINTTKVRITINYETTDGRIFETWKQAINVVDEVREFVGWETPYGKHRFSKPPTTNWKESIIQRILNLPRLASSSFDDSLREAVPSANEPRGMITALNFSLIPILTQQKDTTTYYTNTSLAINTSPTSSVPSGLGAGRGYDPYGVTQQNQTITIKHYSDPTLRAYNTNILGVKDLIQIQLDELVEVPSLIGSRENRIRQKRIPIDEVTLLPFEKSGIISAEGDNIVLTKTSIQSADTNTQTKWNAFCQSTRYALIPEINDAKEFNSAAEYYKIPKYSGYLSILATNGMTAPNSSIRYPDPNKDANAQWNRKIRLILHYDLNGSDTPITPMPPYPIAIGEQKDRPFVTLARRPGMTSQEQLKDLQSRKIQSYYLDIDFSRVESIGDGNSTVRLWRTADMLGNSGSGEVFLSHSFNRYGLLECEIPQSFVTTPSIQGGMGYLSTSATSVYKYTQTIPRALDVLYKNVGAYVKDGDLKNNQYYVSLVNEIFKPLELELDYINYNLNISEYTNRSSVGSYRSPISVVYDVSDLRAYSASLALFAYNNNLPQPSNRIFDVIKTIWSIDATNIAFDNQNAFNNATTFTERTGSISDDSIAILGGRTGTISSPPQLYNFRSTLVEKSWERPSLVGIESVDPSTFNDGFVTPTFGMDGSGGEYIISYGGVQDSVAGTYVDITPTGSTNQ